MAGSHLSQRLRGRRKKIVLIDQALLSLLDRHIRIALEIGKIKKQTGTKFYDPEREKEVLERLRFRLRLRSREKRPLKERDVKKIYATIIRVCRRSQR